MIFSPADWEELEGFLSSLGIPEGLASNSEFQQSCSLFLKILQAKNEQVNLTALRDPDTAFWKHLADSLALLALEPLGNLVDWGSGGGLPGIPMALARRTLGSKERVYFLDSIGKKAKAIAEFCGELKLPENSVMIGRGEDLLRSGKLSNIDTVVMRAVAPAERAVDWMFPEISKWVFFLGPNQRENWEKEKPKLRRKGFELGGEKTFQLPRGHGERSLLWILRSST